jgi:hypothetical protein
MICVSAGLLPVQLYGVVVMLVLTAGLCTLRRAGKWLYAFMDHGDTKEGGAWTFTCPPGHRIVGYGGTFGEFIGRITFLTARFEGCMRAEAVSGATAVCARLQLNISRQIHPYAVSGPHHNTMQVVQRSTTDKGGPGEHLQFHAHHFETALSWTAPSVQQ